MGSNLTDMQAMCREVIRHAFGERILMPRELDKGIPVLAQMVAKITPKVAGLRADHGLPTLGEELAHLLGTLEQYLRDVAPGSIGHRPWAQLIIEGGAYEAFEKLRREAEASVTEIQPDRELNYHWLSRRPKVLDLLWHVSDHTAHHRGRLAILMRMCGVEPVAL